MTMEMRSQKRPNAGGYSRGVEARAKILTVAIEVFGELGYTAASTRTIAARAEVNLGALQYYFGGKEKLYRACAEHIADTVEPRLDTLVTLSEQHSTTEEQPRRERMATLEIFLAAAIDRLLVPVASNAWLLFINREQMCPGPAFDILYDRVVRRLLNALAGVVAPLIGKPPNSEDVMMQTVAVLGPLFIYQRIPAVALRALNWSDFSGERLAKVKAVLIRQSIQGLYARDEHGLDQQ